MVSAALPFPKKTATESVSNSGIEWLSSSAKRQCDQTPQVIIEGLATLVYAVQAGKGFMAVDKTTSAFDAAQRGES